MESLPSEMLVNIFERLTVADVGNCRLLNSRFDQIIRKNSKIVKKPKCSLEFFKISDTKFNLKVRYREKLLLTKFYIYHNKIEVLEYKNEEFSHLLARRLGAPDPISELYTKTQHVYYSGMMEAIGVIVQIVQLKYSVDSLELPDIFDDYLILKRPESSDNILRIINQIGFEGIQYIRLTIGLPNSTDFVDSLLPRIPMKNLNTGNNFVSFERVKTVIENWLRSDWVISLCVFKLFGSTKWRESLNSMNVELESKNGSGTREIFRLKRRTDDHVLRIMITVMQSYYINIKLYEDETYKDKDAFWNKYFH